jgi:hypothetical protein
MTVPVLTGTAILDEDILVDSLVPDVIDGLRDSLQPDFGIRAYRCYRVIRTWSGATPGNGTPTDVAGEIRPYPRVMVWDGFRYNQEASGLENVGRVQLREVSLTYAEADLTGQPLAANQEIFIALADANGQGSSVYLYTHAQPPFIDREKDMGWVVNLMRVQTGVPWAPA